MLAYLGSLAGSAVPRAVLLGDASLRVSKESRPSGGPGRWGIYLYYRPAYSPELNRIEACSGKSSTSRSRRGVIGP